MEKQILAVVVKRISYECNCDDKKKIYKNIFQYSHSIYLLLCCKRNLQNFYAKILEFYSSQKAIKRLKKNYGADADVGDAANKTKK